MMAAGHTASGCAAWLAVGAAGAVVGHPLQLEALAGGTVIAAYAALLPDWDTPSSTIARSLGWPSMLAARFIALVAGGHREGTHSLVWASAVSAAVWFGTDRLGWPLWIAAALWVGYVAGVLGDCLTPRGCPLWWPLSRRRYTLDLFPTDGRRERWLVTPALYALSLPLAALASGMWVL